MSVNLSGTTVEEQRSKQELAMVEQALEPVFFLQKLQKTQHIFVIFITAKRRGFLVKIKVNFRFLVIFLVFIVFF